MQNAKFLFILLIFRFAFAPSFVRKLACRDSASRGNISFIFHSSSKLEEVPFRAEESVILKIQNFEFLIFNKKTRGCSTRIVEQPLH